MFINVRRLWAGSFVLAATLVAGLLTSPPAAEAALPAGGMSAEQLNTTFNSYGDAGGRWTGADSTASVPLPDGRLAWLFSDTFLGTVNADHSRPRDTPMVNNTMVVQDGTSLVSTRHGGTSTFPEALVKPTQAGEYFWVADGTVESGVLKVLYNRYRKSGSGNLEFELTGTALASFALPALTLTSVVDLPLGNNIGWGSTLLEDGAWTYVYGTSSTADNLKFGHVARAPAGNLGGAWQFWTGSTWSSTESQAARLLSGVGTNFGVQRVGSQYVLVTHENNLVFDPQYVAYTAPAPTGPFTGPTQLFQAPEQQPGKTIISYDARLHPALARDGKLLVSYNVNSLNNDDNYTDARIYRPRFVEIDWPRPAPDPSALPAAPAGFTATVDGSGIARLAWQAVPGVTGYRVHRRDVTAGQTGFARLPQPVTGTSTDIGGLIGDHTYELKVTAENAAGEGPFSGTVSVTPRIAPPPAPTGVTATASASGDGRVTVSWSSVPGAWNYEVLRRDVTAGETDFTFVTRLGSDVLSHVLDGLDHNHTYEFRITARHGGGVSPPSATASVTVVYAVPGAPTGLTATARTDGTIGLAWTAPGANVWYWVYQRDVTAGETEFTQLSIPITVGTEMTAGFLLHGHVYEFKVSAINRGGEGPASGLARATSSYPPPAAPSGLTATPGNGEVELNWTASPTDNVWYLVYQRDVTLGESFAPLALPITECCTFSPGFLANGHEYEFKVAATAQGGDSATTNVVRVTPQVPKPGTVTGLTAAAQTDGTIKLSWTTPAENLWFDVYQRDVTAGQSGFTKLALPVTTCCTFNAALLTHNHQYEFKVAATNAGGAGPQSSVASATARYSAPAAPRNLRGEAIGNATINLDWDAPAAGSFFYWVYFRDVTAGETAFTKGQFPTERTEANLGFLRNDHVYEYKVAAENQGGEGATSATVRVTAKGGLPAAPSGLTATAGDGQARLSWTASSTANVTYSVYQRDVTDGQSWQKLPTPTSATSMTAGLLANGHTYEFKVTANNFAGASAASNVASARPMPPLPSAASGLSASAGDGRVTLSWTRSSSPNTSYWIEMRPSGGTWDRLPAAVACCSFTVNILRNGTTYEFRVVATNIRGDSGPTGVASARPMPPFPEPAGTTSVTAGDGQVTVRWGASSTRDVGYYIEMRARGGDWQRLPVAVKCCSYTVKLLLNGTTYDFRIRATNMTGTSAATNVASARPMPPFPQAPTGLSASGAPGKVTLTWNASSTKNVLYWIYYRNLSRKISQWSRATYPTDKARAELFGMFNLGDVYEFQVSAHNVAGEARSFSAREVPRRVLSGADRRTRANNLNGANGTAGLWVGGHGMGCQNDERQVICFGSPPNFEGQPMTVGDVFFFGGGHGFPGTPAGLEDYLVREAFDRLTVFERDPSGRGGPGPDLLDHESIHSDQWARYPYWAAYATAYGIQAAYSSARTGNAACENSFEVGAGLFEGGYKVNSVLPYNGSCN